MTSDKVSIGSYYVAKVSGKLTVLQIACQRSLAGGWSAINMITGRRIIIRSAQRLRRNASGKDWVDLILKPW